MVNEKKRHLIKMVAKDGSGCVADYDNVVGVDYRFGCIVELELADGETATFDTDDWELWDLTPMKGWNGNI